MELVQRVQKEVETIPEVGKSLSAATFSANLGPAEQPTMRQSRRRRAAGIGSLLTKRAAGVQDEEQLAARFATTSWKSIATSILKGDYLREKDGREMWRVSARVSALKNVDYAKFVTDIKAKVEPVLGRRACQAGRRRKPAESGGHLHRPSAAGLQGAELAARRPGHRLHHRPDPDLHRDRRRHALVHLGHYPGDSQRLSADRHLRPDGLAGDRGRHRHRDDAERGAGRVGRRYRPLHAAISPRHCRPAPRAKRP